MRNFRMRLAIAGMGLALTAPWCAAADAPAATPAGGNAAAATAPSARSLVEKVLHDALEVLRDPKLSRDQKKEKVKAIAEATMDFDVLARLAMGANWRDLTDAQRADFTKEFKTHVANTYSHTTDEYTDEDLVVAGDHAEARGDWTVQTRVMGMKDGTRQEIAKVDYRLRQNNGKWMIIDVTIDGVSLMANFRSQFQEIMTNGGYDKLIKLLREKNATGEAAPIGTKK